MFRSGLTIVRRLFTAASLLVLLICGVEVAVRLYEAMTGCNVCSFTDGLCNDPSRLTIPSWSFYLELRPLAEAKVECRDAKSVVKVRTNSLGLRGPDVAIPKPPNLCRIIVLGDETIFAPETSESDHFCTLLQERLQQGSAVPIEVVNAGIPGHCPLTEFLLFKQRLLNLQPDLVLLHFDWSDVADDRQILRRASCDEAGIPLSCAHPKLIAPQKIRPHDVWRHQFRLFDCCLSALGDEWKQQIALQKAVSRDVDTNPYAWLRDERPARNMTFRNAVRPIEKLAELCRSVNVPLAIMTSPKPWQVSEKCSRGEGVRLSAGVAQDAYYSNRAPFDVLARFSDRAGVPLVDGSMVMTSGREAESNFLRYAPRWSPTGHLRMADVVAKFLMEHVDGPWTHPYSPQNEQPISRSAPPDPQIQWTSGQRSSQDRIGQQPERRFR